MLFQCISSKINDNLFEKKQSTLPTISQKCDMSFEDTYIKCKIVNGKCIYPDLELGFGPVVEVSHRGSEILIDIQGISQCNVLENYDSFMDAINYLSSPNNDGIETNNSSSFSFDEEMTKYKNYNDDIQSDIQSDIYTDSLNDNCTIDIPLHLPVNITR